MKWIFLTLCLETFPSINMRQYSDVNHSTKLQLSYNSGTLAALETYYINHWDIIPFYIVYSNFWHKNSNFINVWPHGDSLVSFLNYHTSNGWNQILKDQSKNYRGPVRHNHWKALTSQKVCESYNIHIMSMNWYWAFILKL